MKRSKGENEKEYIINSSNECLSNYIIWTAEFFKVLFF